MRGEIKMSEPLGRVRCMAAKVVTHHCCTVFSQSDRSGRRLFAPLLLVLLNVVIADSDVETLARDLLEPIGG